MTIAVWGCSALKVKLGARVRLEKVQVSRMEVKLAEPKGIAPGQRVKLIVTLTQPDGKVLITEGKGGGKVMWKDLNVDGDVVVPDDKGNIRLAEDPRTSDGKVGRVIVTTPSHPGLQAQIDVPVRYDVAFFSDFSGRAGMDGLSGTDGSDGTSGSMGSIDPNNPSPGGNGGNGSDGSAGHDADSGGNAPNVNVTVALRDLGHPFLQIEVDAERAQRYFLVDTQGGTLTVRADGGRGGSGGRGGRGGRGGSGGSGTPAGSNGMNGSDGRKGFDGANGRGGLITVHYDPGTSQYLSLLHLSSGNGPAPLFHEEAVAPLW